jgi:hypothetical protein
MKKLIIAIAFVLTSCTVNETCVNKTFRNDTWKQMGGNFPMGEYMKFREDSVEFYGDGMFVYYWAYSYQFDEQCGGVTFNGGLHYNITNQGDNQVTFENGDTMVAIYQRQ